jgi:uncharacterized membrane protein
MTATPDPQSAPSSPSRSDTALTLGDLRAALADGIADFRAAPRFGLFFAGVYVVLGVGLVQLGAGILTWTLSLTLAFPLLAPFLAVGLYEVSRRRVAGAALTWDGILGVVWHERTRQIPWAGAVILIYVLFWSFFAHMLFAFFMGPSAILGSAVAPAAWLSGAGLQMVLAEFLFGAAFALLLFGLTAFSLPMLLDREVDFVTAMRASLRATTAHPRVSLVWAATIAGLTLISLLPWFLGLFVSLPVLGHASWHLYRRARDAGVLD